MQQFVFVGSQGSFVVPTGESRVGSDAACQICIRGDGILPVHAYIRTDGEKLLIRPVDGGSSSSGYSTALVAIDGKPVSGSATITSGQTVAIGSVHLTVSIDRPRLWSRRWFRSMTYVASFLATVLLTGYLYVSFVLLDENVIKDWISRNLSACLGREERDLLEKDLLEVNVKLFQGTMELRHLKINDRGSFSNPAIPFVNIESITLKMDVWPLIRSWGREFSNLSVIFYKPEMNLQRSKVDGAFNILDILARLRSTKGPLDAGLDKLNFLLEVKNGRIRLVDSFTPNVGETRLEDINLLLRQPAEGQALVVERCQMIERYEIKVGGVPAIADAGDLKISGRVNLIDTLCRIDGTKISSDDLQAELKGFDLARVFEHFGYSWEPYGANFKVVLGKPLSGQIHLKFKNLRELHLNGDLRSESLLSIREENRPPLGSLPMSLVLKDIQLTDGGNGYLPRHLDVNLRSAAKLDDPGTVCLEFDAKGGLNASGAGSYYSVDLQCSAIQDLLNTDVGRRLGLQDRLGGRLEGNAHLTLDPAGRLMIDSKIVTHDGYVMVGDFGENDKPADEQKPLVRQPLPLQFSCNASAEPGRDGRLLQLDINNFSLIGPSFEARSETNGYIRGFGFNEALGAHARFKLKLMGREFWSQFAPILALFGLTKPVEETFDLTVTMAGEKGLLSLAAEGTAVRQWGPNPAPVKLLSVIDYDVKAAGLRTAGNTHPYLQLIFETQSVNDKPLYVRGEALFSRDEKTETIRLVSHDKWLDTGEAGLTIRSDIATLRERFQPYIEGYLQRHDEASPGTDTGWLQFYRNTNLSGELVQSGRIILQRMLDPKSSDSDRVDFDINMAGKAIGIDMPLLRQKSIVGDVFDERWTWTEGDDATVKLKGNYLHRLSNNKEEPSRESLNIEHLEVKGRIGAFQLTLSDLDLFKLAKLGRLPKLIWTDLLKEFTIAGQVNPAASELLRSLRIIPQEQPVGGSLALKLSFNNAKDEIDIEKFVFKQDEQKAGSFLLNLNFSGTILGVRELVARFLPFTGGLNPFPGQLSTFLEEGGPAALLDHVGNVFTVNSVQIEVTPFVEWLCKGYKNQEHKTRPPAFVESLLRGDWRPEGTWRAAGVRLSRFGDPKNKTWNLVGTQLRSDFTYFGLHHQAELDRPPALVFSHDWQTTMSLSLLPDNSSIALYGDIVLDKACITASLPLMKYEYRKPAEQPCSIKIEGFQYSHGQQPLAHIKTLNLLGKPVEISIHDFDADFTQNAAGSFKAGDCIINGGPLPCGIIVSSFKPGEDMLNATISAPFVNLPYLASVMKLPAILNLGGILEKVNLSYNGSIVALQTMLETDADLTLKRFPDKRLKGLNPETDLLVLDAAFKGVQFNGSIEKGPAAVVSLDGALHMTARELEWKDLSAGIEFAAPENAPIKYALTAPRLTINSADPKLNLLCAMKSPGMPLYISADLSVTGPVNTDAFISTYQALMGSKFNAVEQLLFSGSVRLPSVTTETGAVRLLDAKNLVLKALKLDASIVTADVYGGKLALTETGFDFTKSRLVQSDDILMVKGIGFHSRVKITDADLALLADGNKANQASQMGYSISGRLDADGNMDGMDISPLDRLSWNGAIRFKLSNMRFEAPRGLKPSSLAIAPWAAGFLKYGENYSRVVAKSACSNAIQLGLEFSNDSSTKYFDALLLATQVYLAKACGVELERLDFEPVTATVFIKMGSAEFERFQLRGRGTCAGLELQVEDFKINLADESLAKEAVIYPLSIPKSAQQRLCLERWPADIRDEFLRGLLDGKLPMRIQGSLVAPTIKYPWAELRSFGRRALFGVDRINNLETLGQARRHMLQWWGALPQDEEAAAAMGDRTGVGLPGTITACEQGETIIDRVPGLPQSLVRYLSKVGPVISPLESLHHLLYPEPDPPKQK